MPGHTDHTDEPHNHPNPPTHPNWYLRHLELVSQFDPSVRQLFYTMNRGGLDNTIVRAIGQSHANTPDDQLTVVVVTHD